MNYTIANSRVTNDAVHLQIDVKDAEGNISGDPVKIETAKNEIKTNLAQTPESERQPTFDIRENKLFLEIPRENTAVLQSVPPALALNEEHAAQYTQTIEPLLNNYTIANSKIVDGAVRLQIAVTDANGLFVTDEAKLQAAQQDIQTKLLKDSPFVDNGITFSDTSEQNHKDHTIRVNIPRDNEGLLKIVPSALGLDDEETKHYLKRIEPILKAHAAREDAGDGVPALQIQTSGATAEVTVQKTTSRGID